jgi:hypothetical protein
VGLLSLIARRYTASMFIAQSLKKPGYLSDAVGRFLLHYSCCHCVGLLSLIVRRYTASLPLAQSLKKPAVWAMQLVAFCFR